MLFRSQAPPAPRGGADDILIHPINIENGVVETICDKHGSHKYYNGILLADVPPLGAEGAILHHLRQQGQKAASVSNYCLSDFIAQAPQPPEGELKSDSIAPPLGAGGLDYIGAFAVTAGIGIEALVERFEKDHDDYNSIMVKALADRLAEAFAELMHERTRREFWGYAKEENLSPEDRLWQR